MKRQPRVNPDTLSYNFEQYGRYTNMLAKATRLDKAESERFYKVVKYVKKNKDNEGDVVVRNFTVDRGFDPDLIEIPDEFKDLPIADVTPREVARRKSNKRLVRTRTNKDMTNYDAWRVHDRETFTHNEKMANVAKI